MTQLMNLPNEILERIVALAVPEPKHQFALDIFDTPEGDPFQQTEPTRTAVTKIRLVNRRFNDVSKSFQLRYVSDTRWAGPRTNRNFNLLAPALRLILQPDLRPLLRRLEFSRAGKHGSFDWLGNALRLVSLKQAVIGLPTGDPTDESFQEDWARAVDLEYGDGLQALILELATDVTSLCLTIPYFEATNFGDFLPLRWLNFRLNDPGLSATLPLSKLRHVYLRWWETEGFLPHHRAAVFYHLPSVRTLYAHRIASTPIAGVHEEISDDSDEDDVDGTYLPTSVARQRYCTTFEMSNIEELHLAQAYIDDNGLHDLVAHCRQLKSLKIQWGAMGLNYGTHDSFVWGHIIKLHAKSLEVLELDFSAATPHFTSDHENDIGTRLGDSLIELECLVRLRIDMAHLAGNAPQGAVDIMRLPSSLKHLTLTDCTVNDWAGGVISEDRYIARNLAKVMAECRPNGRFSKLETLDLSKLVDDDPDIPGLLALKSSAKKQGVELKLQAYLG